MSSTLYWLQCGGCGGDSMSLLSTESPNILQALARLDVEMLWHASLSNGSPSQHRELLERLLSGEQELDILCVEGAVIRGPTGSGMFETYEGKPKKDLVMALAERADGCIPLSCRKLYELQRVTTLGSTRLITLSLLHISTTQLPRFDSQPSPSCRGVALP